MSSNRHGVVGVVEHNAIMQEDFVDFLIDAELNDLPVLKRACERYLCGELNTVSFNFSPTSPLPLSRVAYSRRKI